MKNLHNWWTALEQLLLPPNRLCGLCAEYPSLPVGACKSCLDSLSISWKKRSLHSYSCYSLFPYQGYGRELIHRLKFQAGYDIACTFGTFLGLAAREEPELAKVDVLVPVPLSLGRLEQRGFNQAEILADNINKVWKKQISKNVIRVRETKSQSGLSLREREQNMQGVFAIVPGFNFGGKNCLIVDDVVTSGYTFLALARLIEQYGGIPSGLFVARTEILRSEINA